MRKKVKGKKGWTCSWSIVITILECDMVNVKRFHTVVVAVRLISPSPVSWTLPFIWVTLILWRNVGSIIYYNIFPPYYLLPISSNLEIRAWAGGGPPIIGEEVTSFKLIRIRGRISVNKLHLRIPVIDHRPILGSKGIMSTQVSGTVYILSRN